MIRLQWSVQLSFVNPLFVPLPPKIVFTLVYCFLNNCSVLGTDSLSKHCQMVSIQWPALKECSDRYSAIVLGHFGTMRRLSGLRWDTGNGKVEAAQVCERERASEHVWWLNDGWWFIADNSMNAWGKPLIMQHLGCRSILSWVNGRDVQRTATLAIMYSSPALIISAAGRPQGNVLCALRTMWRKCLLWLHLTQSNVES